MKYITLYIVAAIVIFALYFYTTSSNETYIDSAFNVMVVDEKGTMAPVTVRPPYLEGIPPTSNIVYVDSSGNIGVMSVGDVYTSYQGNASKNNVRNLLTIDANNNFSTLSTLNFNPCHVNGDPVTNPNATINGSPQPNGTCACRNNWTGTTKGDGCTDCDGGYGVTHVGDGTSGKLAGPDCQYSRVANCSNRGNIDGNGVCKCDPTYNGSSCQYSNAVTCNNRGVAQYDGSCKCDPTYNGSSCQYNNAVTCNNHGVAQYDGSCACQTVWGGPNCNTSKCVQGTPNADGSKCDCNCSCTYHGGVDWTICSCGGTFCSTASGGRYIANGNTSASNTRFEPTLAPITLPPGSPPGAKPPMRKSDIRLKTNVETLPNVLDRIDKIRGVSHDWIPSENNNEHTIGVIAQEIQEVYPELVSQGKDGFLRVDYGKLTAVLLQAIKELKAEIRR